MKWPEFAALLSGISPESALGRVVAIRSESDPERLKQFSPAQMKIRNDWLLKQMERQSAQGLITGKAADEAIKEIQNIFANM